MRLLPPLIPCLLRLVLRFLDLFLHGLPEKQPGCRVAEQDFLRDFVAGVIQDGPVEEMILSDAA